MLTTANSFLVPLAIAASAGAALCTPPPQVQRGIWQTYERAERFGSAAMGRLVSRSDVDPHWMNGGARFWYRNDGPETREFILVDADRGTRGAAFDHKRLALALGKATGVKVNPKRLPFSAISFPSASVLGFRMGAQNWTCELTSYACTKTTSAETVEPTADPAALPAEAHPPGASPDGKWVAFTRESNVFIRSVANGAETRLSEDGVTGNAYGGVSWAPDSRRIAAVRTRAGENALMYMVDSSPAGKVRPVLRQVPYALPGDRVDTYELDVFDVAAGKQTKVNAPPLDWGDAPEVRWKPDGRHFTFEHTDRGYQRERVEEVDGTTFIYSTPRPLR
jgi:hypothetical protein